MHQTTELQYVQQKFIKLKKEMHRSTIIVKTFNTSFLNSWTTKQKIIKDIEKNQQHHQPTGSNWHLQNIYQIDHMLRLKRNLDKFKRNKIIKYVFDHNGVKLEINNRKIARKSPNTWRLKNTLLGIPWQSSA